MKYGWNFKLLKDMLVKCNKTECDRDWCGHRKKHSSRNSCDEICAKHPKSKCVGISKKEPEKPDGYVQN